MNLLVFSAITMPLHPQAAAFLRAGEGQPENCDLPIAQVRANDAAATGSAGPVEPIGSIVNRFFASPTAAVPLRIFTPEGAGPFPALVYFHGGGWTHLTVDNYSAQLATLANLSGSVVVAVNYQKAPEHKFPVPFDDCFTALEWVFDNADELKIDRTKVGVGGDSAGGNLASAVALKARDVGLGPLAYQLLIYPANDRHTETESLVANASGYGLSRRTMAWLWDCYLNGTDDDENPYAVPHAASDLSGLPPAVVITAEFDVLRDDGRLYAEKLRAAGVPVIHRDYEGMIHGFFNASVAIEQGYQLRAEIADDIRVLLAGDAKSGS